ncbi:MAG: hypothetical protein U9R56_01575 [candidate division Zixibacteria bacterium]|nr:hypothetical protein [candidate division Zixibacteria bacterium]
MLVLWIFFAYKPLADRQASLAASIDKTSHQLVDFHNILKELPHYLETRRELKSLINNINSRLYAKNDVLALFSRLDEEATKRSLAVVEITPPVEELLLLNTIVRESNKLPYLNIDLKLEGSFVDFGRFTGFIEQTSFFRGINRCQITTYPEKNNQIRFVLGFKALLGSPVEET